MSKSTIHQLCETKQFVEICKKFKRSRHFESSSWSLVFLFATACVVCCFVYWNSKAFTAAAYKFPTKSELFVTFGQDEMARRSKRVETLSQENDDGCDPFDGEWVWDDKYPLYQSKDCPFLDEGFRCIENGRPDLFYTKWRWQPRHCNLPRFDAKLMLERLRNKRIVFAGDSIGRNQWESLLCLLSTGISDKKSIYEVNGSPITKHTGFLLFRFEDYNCTVGYYRAPFLVSHGRPPANAPKKVRLTLKLDQMDWNSLKWKDADVLVLNSAHWWNYEKTIRSGSYFEDGDILKLEMTVEHAHLRSMETVIQWIRNEVNTSKTHVFFRTFSPIHFRGGDWRAAGHCHLETLPEMGSSPVPSQTWIQHKLATDVLLSNMGLVPKLDVLNVTGMSAKRKDGHSSLYYLGRHVAPLHRQDCSHWCLPGVPDSWNELLFALFLKREYGRRHP